MHPTKPLTVAMSREILAGQTQTRIDRTLWARITGLHLDFMLCAVSYGRVLSRRNYNQIYILRLISVWG